MATRINWDRDAGDGGLSSNGVLLLWLARPGNYTRWRSPPARNRAATEVVEEMQAHGLHYHTCTSITRGISRLITTYRYTGERYRRYYGREPPASPRMTPESGWESAEGTGTPSMPLWATARWHWKWATSLIDGIKATRVDG
ncbi:hypothetical protein PSHT_14809 [Puccinia striiformis]|uniref:Uncharacterized protein n=1 Tax=Puccinia striiformis TaxID=27350 RepID=A0A2S4UIA7_9BASI|nr:hypothetical protein PSHT_14809 [Puccinia striiformis]